MELSTMIFFSLLLCGIKDVCYADSSFKELAARVSQVESEINTYKRTAVNMDANLMNKLKGLESSLKEELTSTFLPPLIKSLVKQAVTDIMTDDYIGNIISGHVLSEVQRLKASVESTKTQLKAVIQQLKHLEQERDIYRKSLRKQRGDMIKDIRALQLQANRTVAHLRGARTTTHPGTTAASTVPSPSDTVSPPPVTIQDPDEHVSTDPSSTVPPARVTTQDSDLQAPTNDASEDLTPSKTAPPTPVTTQDSDAHATPSQADRDLYHASWNGDLDRVKRILLAGHVNINTRGGEYSMTPVMAAAFWRRRDMVVFLVDRGADLSLVDFFGNNVFHLACNRGDLETVKLILSLNVVDINSRGKYNRTPVMMAARSGYSDMVEFLVGRGADVSLVDRGGNNILHLACKDIGDPQTVKLILSLNLVDINARNNKGRTAAYYARDQGHQQVLDLLVSRGAH